MRGASTASGRVLEIVGTLVRHLFRVAWAAMSKLVQRRPHPPVVAVAAGELRDALADLGPTFMKLGQVLSTRPDLVPPAFEEALAQLQDAAPPVAFAAISESITANLGGPPTSLFSSFSERPLAAASIGQVHSAILTGGREVVVKVRRPGVVQLVELDLVILRRTARLLSSLARPLRQLDVVGFVDDFGATIRGELDYISEGRNAERAREILTSRDVHVPEVIWSHSCTAVLTLERIRGVKVDDLTTLDSLGIDRRGVARAVAEAYLSMVFVDGFFHADPHPGNLFVEASGRLAMVDFGMMGVVVPEVRRALVEILLALASGDQLRGVRALRALGILPPSVDDAELAGELEPITHATVEVPLGNLRLAPLLGRLMAVIRRHRLHFPRELGLLVKTVVMCEGLAAQLDERFSLAAVIIPFVAQELPTGAPTAPPAVAAHPQAAHCTDESSSPASNEQAGN